MWLTKLPHRFAHSTQKLHYRRCLPPLSHGLRQSKELDALGEHLPEYATDSTLRARLRDFLLLVYLKYKGLCLKHSGS